MGIKELGLTSLTPTYVPPSSKKKNKRLVKLKISKDIESLLAEGGDTQPSISSFGKQQMVFLAADPLSSLYVLLRLMLQFVCIASARSAEQGAGNPRRDNQGSCTGLQI